MNTDTNRDLKITDADVIEFIRANWNDKEAAVKAWEQFKSQRSSQLNVEVGWEILSVKSEYGRESNKKDGNKFMWIADSNPRWHDLKHCLEDGCHIHSVKRSSDNSVWTVGDETYDGKITGFNIDKKDNNRMWIEYQDGQLMKDLSYAKKPDKQVPQPLFEKSIKPPLGVTPAKIFHEKRLAEVNAAIIRYIDAGLNCPIQWMDERTLLLELLRIKI